MTPLIAVIIMLAPGDATPVPPPPQPIQIVNPDGTRMTCTPNYEYCWEAQP